MFVENTESHAKEKLVGMYHRKTLDKNKEKVLKSLLSTDGSTRIVVASTSLGMGVNVKDVNYVIHFGPPKEIEDYIQAIGRAGRDGSKSYAILLYTGNQLGKCTSAMKLYAKTTDNCLREALYSGFDTNPKKPQKLHDCCSFCHKQCTCSSDGQTCEEALPPFENYETQKLEQVPVRVVSHGDRLLFRDLLNEYKRNVESRCMTGWPNNLLLVFPTKQ